MCEQKKEVIYQTKGTDFTSNCSNGLILENALTNMHVYNYIRPITFMITKIFIGERAKRARHSQVCSIENRIYIYYGTCKILFL